MEVQNLAVACLGQPVAIKEMGFKLVRASQIYSPIACSDFAPMDWVEGWMVAWAAPGYLAEAPVRCSPKEGGIYPSKARSFGPPASQTHSWMWRETRWSVAEYGRSSESNSSAPCYSRMGLDPCSPHILYCRQDSHPHSPAPPPVASRTFFLDPYRPALRLSHSTWTDSSRNVQDPNFQPSASILYAFPSA